MKIKPTMQIIKIFIFTIKFPITVENGKKHIKSVTFYVKMILLRVRHFTKISSVNLDEWEVNNLIRIIIFDVFYLVHYKFNL